MADVRNRVIENQSGEYFVDKTCINCGTFRKFAPSVFGDSGEHSFVVNQPTSAGDRTRTMQALLSCPVNAIGALTEKVPSSVVDSFPIHIEDGVYINGFNSEKSYGADSYFIQSSSGNWLIDSPRFTKKLVDAFERLGGIRYIFLTHRDDVADSEEYARRFGAKRIIHQADQVGQTFEIVIGEDGSSIGEGKLIHTPGHTEGHMVMLWRNRYLFTGDHLPWSSEYKALRPFLRSCWYSWSKQIESVDKLKTLENVEWVLPGHGERKHFLNATEFVTEIEACTRWMRRH